MNLIMEAPQSQQQATAGASASRPEGAARPQAGRIGSDARAGYDPRQDRRNTYNRPRGGQDNRSGGSRPRGGYGGGRGGAERRDDMDSKLLELSRVSHTRAGGRRLRFRAIVVTGNKTGQVGLGIASGSDVAQAVEKATHQSKKNMIAVPVVNETISREIISKVGPAKVLLKPQQKGRGLMAGGVVRLMCQLAGIKNISSKMLGTTKNKLNNARATMEAFKELKRHAAADAAKGKEQSGAASVPANTAPIAPEK